jgi:hypothetical protein
MPPMWKVKREINRIGQKIPLPKWKIKREIARIGQQFEHKTIDSVAFWYRKLSFPIIKSYH